MERKEVTFMDVNDVLKLVNMYNSQKEEIFDHCADLFIATVRNELEAIYNRGDWAGMIDYTQIGVTITSINKSFREFSINIFNSWNLKSNENMEDFDDVPAYNDFIKNNERLKSDEDEIAGFQGKDILSLKPFCEALERKGFKCYADPANWSLIVAFDVK